mmetsp:Transcript_22966/g.78207  ORF Transcript_22966/g.78207 Transcript_22966/m.78207 type:complete len:295 (+) Transcript_22966:587-1471(+)
MILRALGQPLLRGELPQGVPSEQDPLVQRNVRIGHVLLWVDHHVPHVEVFSWTQYLLRQELHQGLKGFREYFSGVAGQKVEVDLRKILHQMLECSEKALSVFAPTPLLNFSDDVASGGLPLRAAAEDRLRGLVRGLRGGARLQRQEHVHVVRSPRWQRSLAMGPQHERNRRDRPLLSFTLVFCVINARLFPPIVLPARPRPTLSQYRASAPRRPRVGLRPILQHPSLHRAPLDGVASDHRFAGIVVALVLVEGFMTRRLDTYCCQALAQDPIRMVIAPRPAHGFDALVQGPILQ